MKRICIVIIICLLVLSSSLKAQLVGTEGVTSKQIYTGTFVVNGDMNTYYPVVFKYGFQDKVNHIKIFRSYSEAGPDALSPTHKGGLTLEIDANYGGWGGSTYDWRLMDLRQTYHETFAGAAHAMHCIGFVVWLRGGGFIYHYESDKEANLQIAYTTSEIIFFYVGYPQYTVYAPAPRLTPNVTDISSHKNGLWTKETGYLNYIGGNVGIGTTTPQNKLDVLGVIRCTEVKVEAPWADFVFHPAYKLRTLCEVEQFIKANNHLPEIPTAAEVKENGVSLGEMNAKLLQKIEELTLYLIESEKKRFDLEDRVKELETKIAK